MELKPAILKTLDPNQFGVISGSLTNQAPIKMIHRWTEATDGSGASVQVVLFDYQKAFGCVDIIFTKLRSLDMSNDAINWIAYFLTNRQQRVKLQEDCFSKWGKCSGWGPTGNKTWALHFNDK